MAVQAGFDDNEISSAALQAHYLARGNVPQVIRAFDRSSQVENDYS